jgi:hypothetical protein
MHIYNYIFIFLLNKIADAEQTANNYTKTKENLKNN